MVNNEDQAKSDLGANNDKSQKERKDEPMKITTKDGKAYIETLMNDDFNNKIKKMHGKWSPAHKAWVVKEALIENVRKAMRDVFGYDDTQDVETVSVKIRFNKPVRVTLGSINIYGKMVSKAYGRDSGAMYCQDVVYLEGEAKSGGSVRNYESIILEDSVVLLLNVPVTKLGEKLPDGAEIITEEMERKEFLLRRKAELELELLEINQELNEQGHH